MKDYEVEVKERYSHGCYGKPLYFSMVLHDNSCKSAESFAEDIIYNMTYEEFFNMCIDDNYSKEIVQKSFMRIWVHDLDENGKIVWKYFNRSLTDKIGNDHQFTFKARVFRG